MSDAKRRPAATAPRTWSLWVPLLIAGTLLVGDQWLKAWARTHLQLGQPVDVIVPGLLGLTLTYNTGAAWSLLSGSALPLAIGRLLVGLALLAYVVRKPQDRFTTAVLALISAGAIGNAIDGLLRGKVTDMLSSPALDAVTRAIHGQPFPIFNIADSCVVVGVILLLLGSLRRAG